MNFNPTAVLTWAIAGSIGYLTYGDLRHALMFATIAAGISLLVAIIRR